MKEEDKMTAAEREQIWKQESAVVRKAYEDIKKKEMADKEFGPQKIRDQNNPALKFRQLSRVRNASPFYKNQQSKRFGIDGASLIMSSKEKYEKDKFSQEKKMSSTSEIFEN